MNITVLNGSPHSKGNTKTMIEAFYKGCYRSRPSGNCDRSGTETCPWLFGMWRMFYQRWNLCTAR